jgi:hypothetical protein
LKKQKFILILGVALFAVGLALPLMGYGFVPSLQQLTFGSNPSDLPRGASVVIFAVNSNGVNSLPWLGAVPNSGSKTVSLSFSNPSSEASATGDSFTVNVFGSDGNPASNVLVTVASNPGMQSVAYAYTDANGVAVFNLVASSGPLPYPSGTPLIDPYNTPTPAPYHPPNVNSVSGFFAFINVLTVFGSVLSVVSVASLKKIKFHR